jgi:hypothetical protein
MTSPQTSSHIVLISVAGEVTVVGGQVTTVAHGVTTVGGLVTIGDIPITVEETNSPIQAFPRESNFVSMKSEEPAPKDSV